MDWARLAGSIVDAARANDGDGVKQRMQRLKAQIEDATNDLREPDAFGFLEVVSDGVGIAQAAEIAQHCLLCGHEWPVLLRTCAQWQIEEGQLRSAIELLKTLESGLDQGSIDAAFCKAQLGRAFKDWSAALETLPDPHRSHAGQILQKSISYYLEAWRTAKQYPDTANDFDRGMARVRRWAGNNLLTLIQSATQKGLSPSPVPPGPQEIATELIALIEAHAEESAFNLATLGNAKMILELVDEGVALYRRMIDRGASASQLARTLRDFSSYRQHHLKKENVARLMLMLKASLARGQGVETLLTSEEVVLLERFGQGTTDDEKLAPSIYAVDWLARGVERARGIGGVYQKGSTAPIGSGFLIDGAALGDAWRGERLFVTCSHVLSTSSFKDGLPLTEAEIRFERTPSPQGSVNIEKVVFEAPLRLDVTVLALAGHVLPAACPTSVPTVAEQREPVGRLGTNAPSAFVVGHPLRRELAIALGGVQILKSETDYSKASTILRYTSATHPGNSGSPVFDDAWRVIAMHQGLSIDGTPLGLTIGSIMEALSERN